LTLSTNNNICSDGGKAEDKDGLGTGALLDGSDSSDDGKVEIEEATTEKGKLKVDGVG